MGKNNFKLDGLILNLTPTGMIPTKEMNPNVPVTPKEIIKNVLECAKLGANVVHIHARDEMGKPTFQKDIYKKIIIGIREKREDLVIGVSCSGRDFSEYEKRSEVLSLKGDAKPDMASLMLSSLNFNKTASMNSPDMIKRLAEKMMENDIKPELEIFSLGMVNYAHYLIEKNLLKPPYYCNVILGNIACAQAKPLHFGLIQNELPSNSVMTVGGVGDYQHNANVMGMLYADGIRIGLEDNIFFDQERTILATNQMLVKRASKHIKNLGKKISKPEEVKKWLKIKSK